MIRVLTVRDVWAPPFRRGRLGAAVSALDVWAQSRLGAGRFGAIIIKIAHMMTPVVTLDGTGHTSIVTAESPLLLTD